MSEKTNEKQNKTTEEKKPVAVKKEALVIKDTGSKSVARKNVRPQRGSNSKFKSKKYKRKKRDELDKRIVSIRRVSRTYSGGKRMRLSVFIVVGDKKGRVGAGLGKGADVRAAEEKAYNKAKKSMVSIPLKGTTIPHEIFYKKSAAKIFMKPAAPGTGVIAGGAMRSVIELAGIRNILTKVIGTDNSVSNVYATIEALQSLVSVKPSQNNVK